MTEMRSGPDHRNEGNEGNENEPREPGFFAEFFGYLREHKRWWLLPLLILLLILGGLLALAGQNAVVAPFIYTLF